MLRQFSTRGKGYSPPEHPRLNIWPLPAGQRKRLPGGQLPVTAAITQQKASPCHLCPLACHLPEMPFSVMIRSGLTRIRCSHICWMNSSSICRMRLKSSSRVISMSVYRKEGKSRRVNPQARDSLGDGTSLLALKSMHQPPPPGRQVKRGFPDQPPGVSQRSP